MFCLDFSIMPYNYVIMYAKQKHPRCTKNKAKSEAPVSSYSYTRLKSVISGRGQGPSCLLETGKLQLDCSNRIFDCSIRVYRCIVNAAWYLYRGLNPSP